MNQVGPIEQLSTISQRLKGKKSVLEGLVKFSQISTCPNQNIFNMIEYHENKQHQQILLNKNNQQVIQKQHCGHLASTSSTQRKKYQLQRRIPVKQDMGFFGNFMKYLLVGFVIFFLIDFYFDIQNQIQFKTQQIAQCYQDYHQNNCLSPLDALVQECKRLEFCASRDPKSVLKLSNVFIKTVAGMIGMIIEHLQVAGMIFVIVLLLIYFNRPTMYQEQKVSKYE